MLNTILYISCISYTCAIITDKPLDPPKLMKCYEIKDNTTTEATCPADKSCCYGMVFRDLTENETALTETGGCWNEATRGRCTPGCHHKFLRKVNMSMCECNTPLCNRQMTYKEPPLPTQPPTPVPVPPRRPATKTPVGQIIGVVVGCIIVCILLIVAAFVVYKKYIKKESLLGGSSTDNMELMIQRFPNGQPMPDQFGREDELQILYDIGHGRFGQVVKAKLGEQFVAIKKFHPYDSGSFMNELLIMTLKNDPNLLCLLGYLFNPSLSQLWLISEFMPLGNMSDYLRTHTLSIPQCLHLLSSFVSGLCFLHSDPQPVAHRDIKTRNVLMMNHKTCKLADFGLALLLDYGPGGALNEKAAPPTQVGTPRYMAPEVLEGSMFYREAEAHMRIDVYACSLVMWEIMSRTQLDQRDVVPTYMLPFERQIPGHPSACEMQVLVAMEKQRPDLRPGWALHPSFSKLEVTLTESWDNDENARLSSKTIQARIIPLMSNESDSEVSV